MTDSNGYRVITDTGGERHLVDAGGVRYFSEQPDGTWEIAVSASNWHGWRGLAAAVLATTAAADGETGVNQAHGLWRLPGTVVKLATPTLPSLPTFVAQVAWVHDGDTFIGDLLLRYGGIVARSRRMRLAGCNAAELGTLAAPNPAGQAAAANLAGLLRAGMYVTVGIVSETADPHGRLLVTVALPDGTDLVEHLIATQWAARWDGHGTAPLPPWPRTVTP